MDICTLIVASTVTMQLCGTDNVCKPSTDGTKQMCTGVRPKPCVTFAGPSYECKRPDGTSYIFEDNGTQGGTMLNFND
jgi:hypothetical protein